MSKEEEGKLSGSSMKRKRKGLLPGEDAAVVHPKTEVKASDSEPLYLSPGFDLLHPALHQNSSHKTIYTEIGLDHQAARLRLPPHSTVIHGDIVSTRDTFLQYAPKYNLIILDPPWPNRSARRSKHYSISYGVSEIRDLLSNISVKEKLAVDGLVAVWVTNKAAFRDMVLGEGGLFKEWDVGLKEEWVWLKVTEKGEPICALDSVWRKPYEILLVGRGSPSSFGNGKPVDDRDERTTERGKRRVLLGVPDLHSRKPNLKKLMEELLGVGKGMDGKYEALEIFARNLTAGWWAWGDEACKFQAGGHWTPCT